MEYMEMKTSERGVFFSLLLACLLQSNAATVMAVEGFDEPQPVKASEVLPADLIKGKNFQVLDGVTWKEGLHEFTVETEFGSFTVWGEPMLHVRLAEVDAWIELENTSSVGAGVKAVGGSFFDSVGTLASAFSHPIQTVTGVPTGIGRMFQKTAHDVEKVGDFVAGDNGDKEGEVSHPGGESSVTKLSKKMIGVNKSYRRLAEEYGVNPYTSNEAIQEELLRLAQVDAVVRKGSKILLPGIGPMSIVVKVSRAVYEKSWLEIVATNEETLEEMGATPNQIKALFDNESINLTLLTMMLELLKQMENTGGQLNVVEQLILLNSDAEAVYFAESLMMADWYNSNEGPLVEMLPGTLLPVALTADKKVIAFSAADFAYWTPAEADLLIEFTEMYSGYSAQREAWVADQVSPRYAEGLAELGWGVRSGLRSSVMPEIPWGLSDD
jgi:hypothetical protein